MIRTENQIFTNYIYDAKLYGNDWLDENSLSQSGRHLHALFGKVEDTTNIFSIIALDPTLEDLILDLAGALPALAEHTLIVRIVNSKGKPVEDPDARAKQIRAKMEKEWFPDSVIDNYIKQKIK